MEYRREVKRMTDAVPRTKLGLIKAQDLTNLSIPKPKHGDTWGPCTYDANRLVLLVGPYGYEIDLERCVTSAQVLDWIFQLSGKYWMTREGVGHLVAALEDLLNPQAHLCSFGIEKGPWLFNGENF